MSQYTVPDELESSTAKLVYVHLLHAGRATVDEMTAALGVSLSELLAVLRVLRRGRFVERHDDGYALA